MSIRSTAKAVIIDDRKILLNKCHDKFNGGYYCLPGGGQRTYETMHDAVVRECLEETGYTVSPVRLAAMCEEICDSIDRESYPEYAHKMYHVFICALCDKPRVVPSEMDDMQVGTEWVDFDRLSGIRLLPSAVGSSILDIVNGGVPLFLGSEHIPYNHG